jgi:phospholipid-binding lipoprotein MlaA
VGRGESIRAWVACGVVLVLTGCAGTGERLSENPSAQSAIESLHSEIAPPFAESHPLTIAAAESTKPAPSSPKSTEPKSRDEQPRLPAGTDPPESVEGQAEEPYDPFATGKAEEDYDPWEWWNSRVFKFNYNVDKYAIKPFVTYVYDPIMPDKLEVGLHNAYHNIRWVPRFLNNLLQLKFKGAGLEMGRFVINSVFGVGGLFDFAKEVFNLDTPDEDTGQTLGYWGVPPGPYLILPLMPPLNLRDAFGYLGGDYLLDPVNYFVFAVNRVGQPAAISHQTTATFTYMGYRAEDIINERSINLEKFQGVESATVDLYSAVRNAYLQSRAKAVRE